MATTSVVDIGIENAEPKESATGAIPEGQHGDSQGTRYLSAAAYRNRRFRDRVISEIVDARHKALAPNHGVNLGAVTRHCLRARRLKLIRDLLLLGLWIIPFAYTGFMEDLVYVIERPDLIPDFTVYYATPLFMIFGGATLFVFWEMCVSQHATTALRLSRAGFEKDHDEKAQGADLATRGDPNVIVYGNFSPFAGSGLDIGGWSFSLNVKKPKDDLDAGALPKPFELADLYEHVTKHLHGLGIEQLTIADRLCVDGRSIRDDERFLPNKFGRPVDRVPREILLEQMAEPSKNVRFYKMVQVVDWSGEIVVTLFLRFQKSEFTLFTEANYFLLPAFQNTYYTIDEQDPGFGVRKLLGYLATSAVIGPALWLWSPVSAYRAATRPLAKLFEELRSRRRIKSNPAFNYGASASAREMATSGNYRAFFQKLDKEMHFKVIEQELLEAIVSFLDEHDVDTSSLSERKTTILNHGVIVSGGSVKAENLAIGQRAKAFASRLGKSQAGPAGAASPGAKG